MVYGVAAIQWWGFIQQIVLGKPWGNNPGPDWMMWLFWVLFGIGLPVFFHILKLTVEVTPNTSSSAIALSPSASFPCPTSHASRRGPTRRFASTAAMACAAPSQHGLQRQRQSRR